MTFRHGISCTLNARSLVLLLLQRRQLSVGQLLAFAWKVIVGTKLSNIDQYSPSLDWYWIPLAYPTCLADYKADNIWLELQLKALPNIHVATAERAIHVVKCLKIKHFLYQAAFFLQNHPPKKGAKDA